MFCLPVVAAQVGQFIKFNEMSKTSSIHGGNALAVSITVQELSHLYEKVTSRLILFMAYISKQLPEKQPTAANVSKA